MSSTNHTPNLGLSQWVLSDPFRMEDFNADNAKIDAAVAAVPYVKLMGVTTSADAAQVDLDISSIDLSRFSKLQIVASFHSPAATASNSSIYMRLNGYGGYGAGPGGALEGKSYVGTCPVLESTSTYTKFWSSFQAELFGIFVLPGVPRFIGVHTLGCGMQSTTRYAVATDGLFALGTSSTGIQTVNFVGSDGVANIGAGSRFYIYGVKA